MAGPVIVRTYSKKKAKPGHVSQGGKTGDVPTLPSVSSYAFADILREADGPELQEAIDGIAEICAKNKMSLADEYASHLPPLGEITESTSSKLRPHLYRPGMRRALTSVPEASSASSEGSMKSKSRASILNLHNGDFPAAECPQHVDNRSKKSTYVGSTAPATVLSPAFDDSKCSAKGEISFLPTRPRRSDQRAPISAASSLQLLLAADGLAQNG